MKLKGRVAIITGGAGGLGRFFSLCLQEQGCHVVVADIRKTDAVTSNNKIGMEIMSIPVDVTDEKSVKQMVKTTIKRFGRIDILLNNAALTSSSGMVKKPFYEISGVEWDKVINVNLKGPFLCSKAVYPQMKKQGKGKIINFSSGTFFKGLPNLVHYITSKGGIVGFTRALAREVGADGICVNAIAPGYTLHDDMIRKGGYSKGFGKAIVDSRCIKREELPGDLTGAVIFLSSDDSDFITGQTLVVDGGSVLH